MHVAPPTRASAPSSRPAPEATRAPAVHVLLTKFNVLLRGHGADRPPGLDRDWLERRLELFEAWALPSVRRQTSRPLRWLVFVSSSTSASFLERLRRTVGASATLVPVAGVLTDARIADIVHGFVPPDAGALLTTRLDNDDALASRYVETMGREARDWRGFLNPRNGLQLAGSRVLRCWDRSSPFLTLVEDRHAAAAPQTVFCIEHQRAAEVAPVRQLGGLPLWLQVVHGGNLGNEARGVPYPRARASRALGWELPPSAARGGGARPTHLAAAVAHELAAGARAVRRS